MNAIELLTNDHNKVKELFHRYEQNASGNGHEGDQQLKIAQQVFAELTIHSKLEEDIFYPAARTNAQNGVRDMISEAYDEHHEVDSMIEQLQAMQRIDDTFRQQFQMLQQNVLHHVEEEETEMFPKVRQMMSGELDSLGQQMQQRKQELMSQMSSMSGQRSR